MDRSRAAAALVVPVALLAAIYVVHKWTVFGWYPTHDLYAYFYPKALYAVDSLAGGGRGLWWNPYQNCGQPFAALPQTGLWYPIYWLFLLFDPARALHTVFLAHLLIGGVGAFALARTLGARPLAALVGGLAFEMGNAMVGLTVWSPMHCAPFAWLPLTLCTSERLLQAPSARRAGMLAVVLAISMLPGWPQTVFMTYQLIAARVLWEVCTRRGTGWGVTLSLFALVLGASLAAIELVPEIEVVRQSLRGLALDVRELSPQGQWSWAALRSQLGMRSTLQPFLLVPLMASMASLLMPRTRRVALFYAMAACLGVALAFGPGSPFYDLYSALPLTAVFRQPIRFLWITSFCLAVLAALGAEALASAQGDRGRLIPLLGTATLALLALQFATPHGLVPIEWAAAGMVLGAIGLASRSLAAWAPLVVGIAFLVQVIGQPSSNALHWLPKPAEYFATADLVAQIRPRLHPEDRVHFIQRHPDRLVYRLMPKTASLLRLPSITDYEPLTTQRYAEFFTFLQRGQPLQSLNQYMYGPPPPAHAISRRLLDLTAVRYLIVDAALIADVERMRPALQRVTAANDFAIFENPDRLPRAFYASRIEVVADRALLLERLAQGGDDLRQVAFVERAPASGFLGGASSTGTPAVRFVRDDPEHIVLEVEADQRGFVVLTDQFFPGWSARVNGAPSSIERVNYAFRLVEVPAGRSSVEFHFAPRPVWVGAGLSAAAFAVVLWCAGGRGSGRAIEDV